MQTIICIKWGDRYGPEFVNRLYHSILRHTKRKTRLVCFTDNPKGIDADIITTSIPDINLPKNYIETPWRKLTMWKYPLLDLSGDILFLDLDLVITGNIDDLFDYKPGKYCVIENWTQIGKNIGNTSCFRFPSGKYSHIYEKINLHPHKILNNYRIEQVYISKVIPNMVFWPSEWCLSFKHNIIPKWPINFLKKPNLPKHARIVAFTGKPDQDEALLGIWPSPWYKKIYKYIKPASWISDYWK